MRNQRRSEKGVALVAAGIFMVAMLALAAIAVEVARLTDTATEVQVSADVGAMGAAVARARGKTETDAIQAGTDVAALNWADGKPVDPNGVLIEAGHYDPAAAPGSKFDPAGTPHNAFRSTVTVSGVRFLTASILNGQSGTNVQKQAVAAADCPSEEVATFPMAVCSAWLDQVPPGETCTPDTSGDPAGIARMVPDNAQNGCWTNLGVSGANPGTYETLLPEACGGGGGHSVSQGDSLALQNGDVNSFLTDVQCCVACKDQHTFVIPVVDCATAGSCNQSTPALGFTTIKIASWQDVVTGSNGNNNCRNAKVQNVSVFSDCTAGPSGNGTLPNTSAKVCVPGCTNAGTSCANNNACTGCPDPNQACKDPEGVRVSQTCTVDTGGGGGGRCFSNSTIILGQQ